MCKIKCERCGKELNPNKIVWLELSVVDGCYYNPDEFPENHETQGLFKFGYDCAEKELKSTKNLQV